MLQWTFVAVIQFNSWWKKQKSIEEEVPYGLIFIQVRNLILNKLENVLSTILRNKDHLKARVAYKKVLLFTQDVKAPDRKRS